MEYVSQDLTFLYPVQSLSQSIRLIWWTPCRIVCGICLRGVHCPWLLVPCTTPVGGHNFVTACMHVAVPPKPPIKVAILAKSVSQSLALESSTPHKSLAVTFPWLCHMRCPHQTTCYICSLSSFCYIMCVFSTICVGATSYRCAA